AGADQADQNVGVLAAPALKRGIEAIDLFEVAAPERHVGAAGAAPARRQPLAQDAEPQIDQRRHAVDLAAPAPPEPVRQPPRLGLQSLEQDAACQILRQQDARPRHEPAWLGEAAVGGDEAGPRDAVAVEEDDVGAGGGENAAVADVSEAEA